MKTHLSVLLLTSLFTVFTTRCLQAQTALVVEILKRSEVERWDKQSKTWLEPGKTYWVCSCDDRRLYILHESGAKVEAPKDPVFLHNFDFHIINGGGFSDAPPIMVSQEAMKVDKTTGIAQYTAKLASSSKGVYVGVQVYADGKPIAAAGEETENGIFVDINLSKVKFVGPVTYAAHYYCKGKELRQSN